MHHIENLSTINSLTQCGIECESCATHCIDENRATCAKMCLDCSSICFETAAALGRGSHFSAQRAATCAIICDECATECEKHDNEDCRLCAESCRKCAEECRYIHVTAPV
jgi:hypothetical protein